MVSRALSSKEFNIQDLFRYIKNYRGLFIAINLVFLAAAAIFAVKARPSFKIQTQYIVGYWVNAKAQNTQLYFEDPHLMVESLWDTGLGEAGAFRSIDIIDGNNLHIEATGHEPEVLSKALNDIFHRHLDPQNAAFTKSLNAQMEYLEGLNKQIAAFDKQAQQLNAIKSSSTTSDFIKLYANVEDIKLSRQLFDLNRDVVMAELLVHNPRYLLQSSYEEVNPTMAKHEKGLQRAFLTLLIALTGLAASLITVIILGMEVSKPMTLREA